jgi:glycosyltransferase involved in cell wall biosynthesis
LPAYNEEGNVIPLAGEIMEALPGLLSFFDELECVFVDDASTDNTRAEIKEARSRFPNLGIRLVALKRNSGLSAAMAAGFAASRGSVVATLDTDLQNDPRDLPKLLACLDSGDVIIGVRTNRHDTFVKRMSSKIANWIRNRVTGEDIIDTGCSLKVYRKQHLDRIKLFTGLHRFLPTLLRLEGARVIQIPVSHRPRVRGKAKYNFWNRLAGPLMDLFAVRWMQKRHFGSQWEEINGD